MVLITCRAAAARFFFHPCRISRRKSAAQVDATRTRHIGFVGEVWENGGEQTVHLHGKAKETGSCGVWEILHSFFYLPRSLRTLANVADVYMFTSHDQLRQLMDTIHKPTQPITDLPEHEQLRIGYNVTHDAGLIAMGFEVGTTSDEAWVDPPAHRVGVDVMHLSIPDRFTFQTFVETVGDAVSTLFPGFSVPPPFTPPLSVVSPHSVIAFRPFAPHSRSHTHRTATPRFHTSFRNPEDVKRLTFDFSPRFFAHFHGWPFTLPGARARVH